MRRPNNAFNADILLCVASTGGHKSSFIKQKELRKHHKRVLVWDAKDEYEAQGFTRVTRKAELVQAIKRKTGRIAFSAPPEQFSFFCRCAWAWGDCLVIAEELADVVTPAKAPQAWGELLRKGRGFGIRIIATTQRPQEIDKTTIGNATRVFCGVLAFRPDRLYMAKKLGLSPDNLASLNQGQYIYRELPFGEEKRASLRKKAQ